MAAKAFFVVLLANSLLRAQSPPETNDIFTRLQYALQSSGQGADAVADLRAKNYSRVETRLLHAKAGNDAERAELLALRGAVTFLAGQMAEASAAFAASAQLRPPKDSDRFTLAMALVNLGDDSQARSILTSLASQHPQSAVYWYWLGRLDYDQRRYAEAVEKLKMAAERDPESPRIWDSLGLAWDMQGRPDQARPAFDKAVDGNRRQAQPSPWPPHNLGSLLLRTGDASAAESALRESLRYDPNLGRTHYYLARSLEKQGRDTEAISEYRSAVTFDPQSADSCYSLALLYRKLHRDAEADQMLAEFKRRKLLSK